MKTFEEWFKLINSKFKILKSFKDDNFYLLRKVPFGWEETTILKDYSCDDFVIYPLNKYLNCVLLFGLFNVYSIRKWHLKSVAYLLYFVDFDLVFHFYIFTILFSIDENVVHIFSCFRLLKMMLRICLFLHAHENILLFIFFI